MKVSIITVCLNNKVTIAKSLESLNSQTYNNVEHIIKDGLSTDNTISIIQSLSPASKLFSEKDGGIFDALNKAIQLSSGDIVGILHADDFFQHDKVLEKVVETFLQNNCDAAYGDLNYVQRDNINKTVRKWKSDQYIEGDFLKGWMPPHPAFFVKREIIEKYGAYNIDFKSAADYEWMLRLIHKHKIKLTYLPETLVSMRTGGKSNKSLKNRLLANVEDRKAWIVNDLKPKWYTLWMKPFRKLLQWV